MPSPAVFSSRRTFYIFLRVAKLLVTEIIFTESFEPQSEPGVVYIYDDTAEFVEDKGFFRVDKLELTYLDSLHLKLQRYNPVIITGIGGFIALNAAKVLSVRRLKKGGLKQAIFENTSPSAHLVLVPTRPALCTEASSLTLVFDANVPTYYVRFIPPTQVRILSDVFVSHLEGNTLYTMLFSSPAGKITVQEYISKCKQHSSKLFGTEFIMALSIASHISIDIERVVSCLTSIFKQSSLSSVCHGELQASLRRVLEKKIDNLVEHSWSFYRNFLVYWGVRSRGELYKKYLTLLSFVSA